MIQPHPSPKSAGPKSRVLRRGLPVVLVGLLLLAIATFGIGPTFLYRQAVHSVHDDIERVDLVGVELIGQRIDRCWNGVAPASVTVLRSVAADGQTEVVAALREAFEAQGYVSEAPTAFTRPQRWTRERNDDLDFDVIELTYLPDGESLQLVGDVYDSDLVFCPPF